MYPDLQQVRVVTFRAISRPLRGLLRHALRARWILANQGPRTLLLAIERRFQSRCRHPKPEISILDLHQPLEPLRFRACTAPAASIIVPMRGDRRLAHHCLASINTHPCVSPFEVILLGQHSGDATGTALPDWDNVRVVANPGPLGLGGTCERALELARGEFLVLLDEHTQVQAGWLDALIDTFDQRPDAGMVGCQLLDPEGRQLEAGGVVYSDGTVRGIGCLDDSCRPEYGYLRPVDFCAATALAIRRSLLTTLAAFDTDFARSRYAEVDLAFRARAAGYSVYYQPYSKVVYFGGENVVLDGRGPGEVFENESDRGRFCLRWQDALRSHAAPSESEEQALQRLVPKRAFVADFAIPTPDRDSGSLRMVNLLSILQEQGFSVTFASMGLEARQPYLSDLQKRGIECLYRPYETSIVEHLRQHGARYNLVVLGRLETAAELLPTALRWCPGAKVVFDTVDLHFKRVEREAELKRDARIRRIAKRTKEQELSMVAMAHTTLVVSVAEKALLTRELPGADVRVVSNIHRVYGNTVSFASRRDILFVGGFAHPPNLDAVLWFCQAVLPEILQVLPDVRFYVVGSDPPEDILALAGDHVSVLGYVRDIRPYLDNCRLSVAPLRFGSGVKGKVNQSLAHGLPVVATSIAAEGMFLAHGESVLIANDAPSFAKAVAHLYANEKLWNQLSAGGLAVMEEHFSFAVARKAVAELVSS